MLPDWLDKTNSNHWSLIESIPVLKRSSPQALFDAINTLSEITEIPDKTVFYLNVHVANTAWHDHALKPILQSGTCVYCDGAGIVVASKLLGNPIPIRLTSADWITDLLAYFAAKQKRLFLVGSRPGLPEKALAAWSKIVPNHTIVGVHHGYFLNDSCLEDQVIAQINQAQPDILIVGFGTPLQEKWIAANRHRLNVPVVYAIGAIMDYASGELSRCPRWLGDLGFEWLFRLWVEPRRLFGRYVIGNPWFFTRIVLQKLIGTKA